MLSKYYRNEVGGFEGINSAETWPGSKLNVPIT